MEEMLNKLKDFFAKLPEYISFDNCSSLSIRFDC